MKFIAAIFSMLIIAITMNLSAQNAPIATLGTINTSATTATVPITAINFNNIGSCNLKILYDHTVATPTSVTAGTGMGVNFTAYMGTPGVIILGWYSFPAVTLSNGSTMFNISFTKVSNGNSVLSFDDDQLGAGCTYSNSSYEILNDIPNSTYYTPGSLTFFNATESPVTVAPIITASAGSNINVPIKVSNFNQIGSVALILKYNSDVISFNSGTNTSGFPGLTIYNPIPGVISISGFTNNASGYSLANNSIFLTLNFTYIGGTTTLNWFDDGESCEYATRFPDFYRLNDTPQSTYYINGSVGPDQATPTPIIVVGTITNPSTCGGNGTIPLTFTNVTNGTYTISYDGGGSFSNVSVLGNSASISAPAGTYNNLKITVNGITSAAGVSASLIGPSAPDKPVVSVIQPTCANPNGSVAVTSTKTDLTFSTDGTNYAQYSTPFIVAAGANYSITAKNLSGCVSIAATGTMGAALTAPDKPVVSVIQPTCENPNGSVAVTSTKTDLTFSTDGTNYAPYSTPFIVAAGANYSITAKNLSGCVSIAATGTMGAALTAPDKPVVSVIQPTCANPNGSVAVTSTKTDLTFSTDGTNYAPYSTPFIVAAGANYSITAKNLSGCVSIAATGTMGAALTAPDKPVVSVIQPTCANQNGSVAVTSTKTDLTFSTDGTNYAPYSTPFIVAAGANYSITAKNLSGCVSIAATGTMGAALTAPDKPVLSVIQPTCENPNGSVAVTSDKTGLWFSIDGSNYTNTNGIFTGLVPGDYYVTTKNNAGCVSPQSSFTINENLTTHGQWLGITSDWDKDFNWCGGIPTSSTDVSIPLGVIQPVIGASTSASCKNITIADGATLTLESNAAGTGSLIVSGIVSGAGSVIAQRYMKTNKWNYVSSPVSGQSIHNFLLANDNIAIDENTVSGQEHADATTRGMMDYNPASNVWNDYFTNSTSGNLGEGKGFCMRTTTDGAVSFTGNLQTGFIFASASASYWNCIGNPYTSAIGINDGSGNGTNFLLENKDNLDLSYGAIYVWDKADEFNGGDNYAVYSNASIPYDFQQGQAFMIKIKSSASQVIFKSEMQVHDPGLELKSTKNVWPTIKLAASFNAQKSSTIITFSNGMTNGLDPTYDAGLLKAGSDLSVFSRLVEDNGIPFAIQALPLSDLSGTIIPIGLDFKTGGEVAFSAELINLPSDGQVILEDKLSKAFTDLSKEVYKTYISANTSVSDRFQIHISSLTTGVKIDTSSDLLNAFAISRNEILIKGQVSNQAVATLYDIQGRVILVNNLKEGSLNIVETPNIRTGIYMLSVKDNGKVQGFKIPVK